MKLMIKFFTIVYVMTLCNLVYASKQSKIEITKGCNYSKNSKDFQLSFSAYSKDESWYVSSTKKYSLYFTNQKDCDQELEKLRANSSEKMIICACSTAAKADALFLGNISYGFSRQSCIKFNSTESHIQFIKNKRIIRNTWDKLSSNEQEVANLDDYFDLDQREGQNYQLCKKQSLTLMNSN